MDGIVVADGEGHRIAAVVGQGDVAAAAQAAEGEGVGSDRRSKTIPPLVSVLFCRARPLDRFSVPAETAVGPEKVLAAVR